MILPDVNVLLYAHREDAPEHEVHREWLSSVVAGDQAYAVSELILSGALRILTHPRIFDPPTPTEIAVRFLSEVRDQPHAVNVAPGPDHWNLFVKLCAQGRARGDTIPDAYIAALAIESGSELITADRGFARFPGLQWRSVN